MSNKKYYVAKLKTVELTATEKRQIKTMDKFQLKLLYRQYFDREGNIRKFRRIQQSKGFIHKIRETIQTN
ncbi:MAG: hypothetical protein ACOCQR_03195 [bacterium]